MAWTHTRAKIAHAKKYDHDADVTDLKRQLKAERLEERILEVLASEPPLTSRQRKGLASLFTASAVRPLDLSR